MTGKSEKQIGYASDLKARFLTNANETILGYETRIERLQKKDAERYAEKIGQIQNCITAWKIVIDRLNEMDDAGEVINALTSSFGLENAAMVIARMVNIDGHTIESAIGEINSGRRLSDVKI